MKLSQWIIFVVIVFLSIVSHAWKDVGNAAGISEQNIIYAMQNSENLLSSARRLMTSPLDQEFFKEFLNDLRQTRPEFNYDQNQNQVFSVNGLTWTFYSFNLYRYDFDGNEVLSLKESYKLLLDVYAFKHGYCGVGTNRALAFQEFEKNILNILVSLEKTIFLKNFEEQLQWTQLEDTYYIFYADVRPLPLTAEVLKPRLCIGELSDLKLVNPALTSAQQSHDEVRFLLTVDSYYTCDGKASSKKLMLDLRANNQLSQLLLH